MDLSWNDRRTRQFLTNVGLITSDGPHGPNVMAAEWTHHISYSPSLIAVNIRGTDATAENIKDSKEFGVNIAAEDQNLLCSLAGRYSGKHIDKVAFFKEIGVVFYNANKVKALLIRGAAMNAECKLLTQEENGDHIMFVGEVIEITADENTKPLVYHNGMYWKLGDNLPRPRQEILDGIELFAEKYKKGRNNDNSSIKIS
jgi:flavin reductase (DIM6/NTAB) family NADH-FMN oxidoreductase RutF